MRSIGARLSEVLRSRAGDDVGADPGGDAAQYARLVRGFEAHGVGWLWETDRHGVLTYLSDKVAGQLADDAGALGRSLTDVFEPNATGNGERTLRFHMSAQTSFIDFEVTRAHGSQERCWSISGRPWFDEHGRFRGFVGSGCDLTEQRRSEAEITRLAMFDSLTGLSNRASMRASLNQALVRSTGGYRPTALLLLDLDRFKAVNDTMGHPVGDMLLQQVAERLIRVVGENGLVGRLGGDEFKVIIPGESNRDRLSELSQRIIAALSKPYFIQGMRVVIGCSIGVAIAPDHGEDAETLIRSADLALYAGKADGRGIHRFYREALLTQARTRKMLEDDLRNALSLGQLRLVYQPVVSTAAGQVVGYEALLRWQHPVRGAISPAEFIPVAEESGLIDSIGEWVLRTACAAAAAWPAHVRLAVNVSPVQFGKQSLPAVIASALATARLDPQRLELEITEGVFLDGAPATEEMFQALKRLGVRLALDDFGTGYSSLGYLRTAPFDKIKIDQSFVRGAKIPGSRNAAIIKAIVTLADTLELETTAEGVEAQDEIELIRALGCSHIQGFVYSKPVPPEAIPAQLGMDGLIEPVGVRVTRPSRTSMLRSTFIRCRGRESTGRIRNVSATGAMVELQSGLELAGGERVELELFGEVRAAEVRWSRDGRAGLRFSRDAALCE